MVCAIAYCYIDQITLQFPRPSRGSRARSHDYTNELARKRVLRDNFGLRTRITLYARDISSTSESFHVCEQSYITDVAQLD